MPLLAAAPLVSLFFFSGFANAGAVAPPCTLTGWEWVCMLSFLNGFLGPYLTRWHFIFVQSYNSLNQNACAVAAFMMATCNAGSESFVLHARALTIDLFPAYT